MQVPFWEKATAIHVFCLQERRRGDRFARHWHDVAVRISRIKITNFANRRAAAGNARCADGGRAKPRRSARTGGAHVGGARCRRAARRPGSGEPRWTRRVASPS
uniref:Uncharacterized protein n=1 Tax=Rhizobium loti TaxID=381 RepID=M5ALJ6_RHILI|nr:conserved hypothetical protein [Mesorhizobium loti NZP2037]